VQRSSVVWWRSKLMSVCWPGYCKGCIRPFEFEAYDFVHWRMHASQRTCEAENAWAWRMWLELIFTSLHSNPSRSADLRRRPHWYHVNIQANCDYGIAEALAMEVDEVTRHRDGLGHDPTNISSIPGTPFKMSTLPSRIDAMHGNKLGEMLSLASAETTLVRTTQRMCEWGGRFAKG